MSGKKGRSGRKPAPKNLIDRMLEKSEPQLPEIWQGLVDLATGVKIGTVNVDGEIVNVYSKPPDKEAIAEITNRHFGRPKIELDQRLKTETQVTLDTPQLRQAAEELAAMMAEWSVMSASAGEQPNDPPALLEGPDCAGVGAPIPPPNPKPFPAEVDAQN